MIKCNKCGFGHKTSEELATCKSWEEMQSQKAGAESADIGKLDSADETAITFSQGAPPMAGTPNIVSSGVEGAHEGTTVDKSVALAESSLSSPPQNADSSAPMIPETTGLSTERSEDRTASEIRRGNEN